MLSLVCLLVELIPGFVTAILTWETGGLELASTITLVLQANRLTKCASLFYKQTFHISKVRIKQNNKTIYVSNKENSIEFKLLKTSVCVFYVRVRIRIIP